MSIVEYYRCLLHFDIWSIVSIYQYMVRVVYIIQLYIVPDMTGYVAPISCWVVLVTVGLIVLFLNGRVT